MEDLKFKYGHRSMKTRFDIVSPSLLIIGIFMSSYSTAKGREGNGGGGIERNGTYLTFGSAGVQVTQVPLKDIPGMNLLLEAVKALPLPELEKGNLLKAVYPLGERRYFSILNQDLDPNKETQLKKSYHQAIGGQIRLDELVVYSLTSDRESYLLPEFYYLSEVQQAAILFHESLWILNAKFDYRTIIDAEIKFERYLTTRRPNYGFESDLFSVLNQVFDNPHLALMSAAKDDFDSGRLKKFLDPKGRIPLTVLFGENIFSCTRISSVIPEYSIIHFAAISKIVPFLLTQIETNENVAVFRESYTLLSKIGVQYSRYRNDNDPISLNYYFDIINRPPLDHTSCEKLSHDLNRVGSVAPWQDSVAEPSTLGNRIFPILQNPLSHERGLIYLYFRR